MTQSMQLQVGAADGRSTAPASELAAHPFVQADLPRKFGRYLLTRVLGVGGMGTVYLAEDTALQRRVALKIPNRAWDKASIQKLLEEARAAAKVSHTNVCSLYDAGCIAGCPYLTMEYIDGKPLDQFVASGKPMSPRVAAQIILKIAAGLHEAHQQGVIHRDLKPANILMRDRSVPVITDFGLAHRSDQLSLTRRAGRIVGSPSYMSPEQVRGDLFEIGPATDVYGLGAILYELLTGQRPFSGQVPAIYSQVLTQSPAKLSEIVGGIDPRLERICLRALSKSPTDRFENVVAFGREVAGYLQCPGARAECDSKPLVIAPTRAKTVAQSIYSLESRAIDQCVKRPQPSPIRSMTEAFRRWRWKRAHQQKAFVSGLVTASLLFLVSIVGAGIVMSVKAEGSQPEPTLVAETHEGQIDSQAEMPDPR